MAAVETVLGPVSPADLGVTLCHEHLLLDARPSWHEPKAEDKRKLAYAPVTPDILHALRQDPYLNFDNCFLDDEELATEEVAHFAAWGGRTVVDATCLGIGRNPIALKRIAEETGLNIVMGTGFYLERTHPPSVQDSSPKQLTELMVSDLKIGEDSIKAGYIGEIGVSAAFTAAEEKVLRAAARAQAQTNVALSVHLPGWERHGHRVLDIVAEEGGALNRTILDHMNPSWRDVAYQTSLADRGAYLEYDMMGMTYEYPPNKLCPDDSVTVGAIKQLIDDGFLERILMSQDVFLKSQFRRFGGVGFTHIFTSLRTQYERLGIEETSLTTIFSQNPQRVLAFL